MQKESTELIISKQLIAEFELLRNSKNLEGMARFGINTSRAFGVSMPVIRAYGKKYKKNHKLAQELWKTGYHELRIMASIVDDPKLVTQAQMDEWVHDFNSWDICDQCCMNLFKLTPFAGEKAIEWTYNNEEYVKRAGFAIMACIAHGNKNIPDDFYIPFFKRIAAEANDDRNFVKKAVNWALRQIGKRNLNLHKQAIECAQQILQSESKTARWIAADALREFANPAIINRIK